MRESGEFSKDEFLKKWERQIYVNNEELDDI